MVSRYLLVWLLLAVIGVANGVLREATYGRIMGDLAAHQMSTLIAIVASGGAVYLVYSHWPIGSMGQAWLIGVCWLIMTIAFEFGFGHFVAGHSFERLLADYDLRVGRLWSLFLAWILVLPALIHWIRGAQ